MPKTGFMVGREIGTPESVPMQCHRHVIHGHVATGDEDGKMSTVKDDDVAEQHMPATLERDGFVAFSDRTFANVLVASGQYLEQSSAHFAESVRPSARPAGKRSSEKIFFATLVRANSWHEKTQSKCRKRSMTSAPVSC